MCGRNINSSGVKDFIIERDLLLIDSQMMNALSCVVDKELVVLVLQVESNLDVAFVLISAWKERYDEFVSDVVDNG